MGVIGTSCLLCNLPLNHDHYVRSPSLGMYKIYRSSRDGGQDFEPDERVVHFAPEHAWLCDAVAVTNTRPPRRVEGTVEDGGLGELFVADGFGEAFPYHRYCHDLMGAPTALDSLVTSYHTYEWAHAETYNGQLFDLRLLVDHGKQWMLADPRGDSADALRSRARIDQCLAQARVLMRETTTVAELLATDRDWLARSVRLDDDSVKTMLRLRDVDPSVDFAGYPALVWAMKEYGEGMCDADTLAELEDFERAVKVAVEANAGAILLMVTIGQGQLQLVMQARDEAATRAKIEALPQGRVPLSFDNERDEAWKIYFTQLAPH